MSTQPDTSTDGDREALEAVSGDSEPLPVEEQLQEQRRRNDELEEDIADLRDELEGWKETVRGLAGQLNDVSERVRGRDPTDPRSRGFYENLTILEKYSRMDEAERNELLAGNPSKLRAVLIFENWENWSNTVAAGQVISTNSTRGRYNKMALRVDLQSATGKDLENIEVYRAMKMVAKLSVQERDQAEAITDEYDREHIRGGAFEFHDKVNTDANGGKGKSFKILKLVDPEAVILP